jgi:FkbM family methyltransferase
LVGEDGFIYCIEANPLCVYFLGANLDLNEISNCQILPIGLTKDQSNLDFTINYGNSALGVAKSSPLYTSKVGHEFLVHGCSLDILISTYQLKPPDMIKIDIEGGEGYAIKGMHKTLKKYLPVVLIEIHGRKAAKSTFHQLGKLNYRFQDIGTQQIFTDVKPLMDWFPDAVRQFLCTPGREQMFTD